MTDGFLKSIVAEVRRDVGEGRYVGARGAPRPPSLRAAIDRSRAGGALVVELKRNSPGQADPRLPARSAEEFVRSTRAGGVAGYSCLATRPHFDGSVDDVAAVVRATELPVLFKDFVVDPVQIDAAARAGAAAVLLIARLEDDPALEVSLAELADVAHGRGLEVLLEFHAKAELRRAADVPADVYGVNVRDLDSLRMEPEVAAETIRAAAELRPLLSMSGVGSALDARRAWDAGADGLLVGTSVARAEDPAAFLRSLHRAEHPR